MYTHLTKEERDQIAVLNAQFILPSEIGRRIARDKSTISTEIRATLETDA